MRESCYIAGKAERIRILMNFIQLEYFQKTVECRSVTEAAKKLFITQPAVSKQLRLLEEELECKLFQRKGNHLVPTAAGEFFYQRVKTLLNQFSDLPVEMKSFLHQTGHRELQVHQLPESPFLHHDTSLLQLPQNTPQNELEP